MSTRSMSTWKYRHENKEPLEMDDGHEGRAHLVPEDPTQPGTLWKRMRSAVAALSMLPPPWGFSEPKPSCRVWGGCSRIHTLQVRSSLSPHFQLFTATNTFLYYLTVFSSHFLLEPEVTHRPAFPGELSLLCLPGIQLKSWLFWQSADIKVFYWKW